jgi:hypothetical protein
MRRARFDREASQTPTIPFAIVNAILKTIADRHEEIIGRQESCRTCFPT